MYTLYSSTDKINFDFEEQNNTLPETIKALGKWLAIRAMNIDEAVAKDNRWPEIIKEHWFIFEGPNNIDGKLIGSTYIEVKRNKQS